MRHLVTCVAVTVADPVSMNTVWLQSSGAKSPSAKVRHDWAARSDTAMPSASNVRVRSSRDRYRVVLAAQRDARRERPLDLAPSDASIRVGKEPAAETLGPASRASREDEAARLRSAFQGLPYEEVARGTGSTLKQARLRVLKAKLRLAEALRNR